MKIKTSHSFFPTKIPLTSKSPSQSHTQTYKLIKKKPMGHYQSGTHHPYRNQEHMLGDDYKGGVGGNHGGAERKVNIFQEEIRLEFDKEVKRPVGGMEMFKKEEARKNKEIIRKRRFSRDHTSKQILQNNSNAQSFKRSNPSNCHPIVSTPIAEQNEKSEPTKNQEVFKQHQMYESHCKKWKSRPSTSGTYKSKNISSIGGISVENSRSLTSYQQKFKDTHKHSKWVTQQNQAYQTKMGFINQIFFKKPLIQRYGDRYFQYILRNRYQQDFQPPQYIHQLDQNQQPQTLNKDRFISKLRKLKPNIKIYEKLALKGNQIHLKQDSNYQEQEG